MYRIAICDHEVGTCGQIEALIIEFAKRQKFIVNTEVFYSGDGIIKSLKSGRHYNIIFLDIIMSRMNGINIGEIIRGEIGNQVTHIVYISRNLDYAADLLKVKPIEFLIKPIRMKDIEKIFHISRQLDRDRIQKFIFQSGKQEFSIPFNEILYFFKECKKVHIIYKTLKVKASYYGSMKSLAGKLPDNQFWVIHKSYIINSEYAIRFASDEVEMINGVILPISQAHRKDVKEKLIGTWDKE